MSMTPLICRITNFCANVATEKLFYMKILKVIWTLWSVRKWFNTMKTILSRCIWTVFQGSLLAGCLLTQMTKMVDPLSH